jgi:hypothetical protein
MIKILTAAALAVMIASPAQAASPASLPHGAPVDPGGSRLARLVVDPPDTGSEIIECGPGPARTDLETQPRSIALAEGMAPCLPCPGLEQRTARDRGTDGQAEMLRARYETAART